MKKDNEILMSVVHKAVTTPKRKSPKASREAWKLMAKMWKMEFQCLALLQNKMGKLINRLQIQLELRQVGPSRLP